MKVFFLGFLVFSLLQQAVLAQAATEIGLKQTFLKSQMIEGLQTKFPGARIELDEEIHWKEGKAPEGVSRAILLETSPKGYAKFRVYGLNNSEVVKLEASIEYNAWVGALVPKLRIKPMKQLKSEFFSTQEIDISRGLGHQFRGLVMSPKVKISELESKQTLLEGNFLIRTAVQKIPDVKRGDSIRLRVYSGNLTVSASAVAQEPGYIGDEIRVRSEKTKQVLVGKVTDDGFVEVRL